MKSYTKTKVLSSYLIILLIGLFCSGFFGKKKKDIDVKGIHSVAVIPFHFTRFKYFSENSGNIVSENMSEILNAKCKWETPTQEIIKAAINELGIKPTKMLTKAQATDLGKKLEVDLVIYGSLPVYDEHEGAREIQESRGGGFTENIREITVEYDFYLIRISDGTLIKNIKKSAKERDTAKDPMMPAPPDKQLRRATRSMTKKLVKQFIVE